MRGIASLLVFFLTISFCIPLSAQAANQMSAREAAERVKTIIRIPDDVKEFNSNYSENQDRGQWELFWDGKKTNLRVNIDASSGDIVNLYRYVQSDAQESRIPKVSKNEALNTAKQFLKKAVPDKWQTLVLTEKEMGPVIYRYNQNYSFVFERQVNGVAYPMNRAEITISGNTGEVQHFNLNWDYEAQFRDPKGAISQEKASQILKDNQAMELMYYEARDYSREKQEKPRVLLVYGIRNPLSIMVDALTGEYIDDRYGIYALNDRDMAGGSNTKEMAQELSPLEMEEIDVVEGLLSKEEALEKALDKVQPEEGFNLISTRLFRDYRDLSKRSWSFNWEMPATDGASGHISARVDAANGELLSFSKWMYEEDRGGKKPVITVEEARNIAQDYLAKLQPHKFKSTRYDSKESRIRPLMENNDQEMRFNFFRIINNIPFYQDGFSVTVDRVTGEVISYQMNWLDTSFRVPNAVIDPNQAFNNLVDVNPITMDYIKHMQPEKENKPAKTLGVYYHFNKGEPVLIDAFKGAPLQNNGEKYVREERAELSDIKGLAEEEDIKVLYDLGIVTGADGKFFPQKIASNAEFIKMLILSIGASPGEGEPIEELGDGWYAPYYQTAVHRNIITRDALPQPDQPITRIMAARFMLKAGGLQKVAELEGIFKVPAKDADQIASKDQGYAAISVKMGIIAPINQQFVPEKPFTRAEIASTLVNFMKCLPR